MRSIPKSPPRLVFLYLAAAVLAVIVAVTTAVMAGAFHHDPSPDPVRGSPALLFAIVSGYSTFFVAAALLMTVRWTLWRQGRTWHSGVQLIVFLLLAAEPIAHVALPPLSLLMQPGDPWVELDPIVTPEGSEQPYFPPVAERLERHADTGSRFVELAVENAAVYKREGFILPRELASQVATPVAVLACASDSKARSAMQELAEDLIDEGYRRVPESRRAVETRAPSVDRDI